MDTHARQSDEVVVLRYGRLWALLLTVICVVFIAGVWSIRDEEGRVTTWIAVAFFGFGALMGIVRLLPGANYLRLDPSGFTYCMAFYRRSVAWQDVGEFGVVPKSATRSYSIVNFNYVPGYAKDTAVRELAKSLNGWEAALPGTYGKRADDLARQMNEWLQRHGKNRSS